MGWLTDWRRKRVLSRHRMDDALWKAAEDGLWSPQLAQVALDVEPNSGRPPAKDLIRPPKLGDTGAPFVSHGILLHYRDGLRAIVLASATGGGIHWHFACRLAGEQKPRANNAAGPLFMIACSWLLEREKASLRQIAGMLISFLGVLIIVSRGDSQTLLHLEFHRGDAWHGLAGAHQAGVRVHARPDVLGMLVDADGLDGGDLHGGLGRQL